MTTRRRHRVTAKQIDALLIYLPNFERLAESPAVLEMVDGDVVAYNYQPEFAGFIQTIHDNKLLLPFDMATSELETWLTKITIEVIHESSLPNLLKLLSYYIYQEQSKSGTLQTACETGHLVAILQRFKQIRQTMTTEDVVVVTYEFD